MRNQSQKELADAIGITSWGIANYEKGFNDIFYDDALKIAQVLKIDSQNLLDEYGFFCQPGYGLRIKKLREAYKLSQNRFAEQLGVSRHTISIWEIEYKNHHPNRTIYDKLKILAQKKGVCL